MTNNKHKEIMERWNNSELAKRINAIEMFAINHHFSEWNGETIPQFISSALTEQLEELERWVESKRTFQHSKGGDEGWGEFKGDWDTFNESIGYHKAIDDTLSHIREQKEIIKNNKN